MLLVLLCALLGAVYAALWQPPRAAQLAEIRVSGRPVQTLDLQQPQVVEVLGATGASRLKVSDGRIRFIDGPCRNRICIHSGWLAHTGDGAACVPNRVSVTLQGGDGVDSVSF